MEFYNVFKDKAIINIIPLFTGLYIAYNTSLRLIPVLLILSVLLFYLLMTALTKKLIEEGINRDKTTEKELYERLIQKKYKILNILIAFSQVFLLIITSILLYQFRKDFICFLLFWSLIIGFTYNLLSLFVNRGDIIKKSFKFGLF